MGGRNILFLVVQEQWIKELLTPLIVQSNIKHKEIGKEGGQEAKDKEGEQRNSSSDLLCSKRQHSCTPSCLFGNMNSGVGSSDLESETCIPSTYEIHGSSFIHVPHPGGLSASAWCWVLKSVCTMFHRHRRSKCRIRSWQQQVHSFATDGEDEVETMVAEVQKRRGGRWASQPELLVSGEKYAFPRSMVLPLQHSLYLKPCEAFLSLNYPATSLLWPPYEKGDTHALDF